MTLRRTEIPKMSAKRRAERAAEGDPFPTSTFRKTPKMATPKRAADTGPVLSVKQLVKARSGGRCEFPTCLDAGEQLHHRRPRRMGGSTAEGTNGAANLVDLCSLHHTWVESRRAVATEMGLLLPANANPAQVPVWTRHSDEPVFLTPEGGEGGWVRYEEAGA